MKKKDSIATVFVQYRGVMSSLLKKMTRAPHPDIEDILQETFLRTYQSELKQEVRFPKAFMVKTALRLARDQQKHLDRHEGSKNIDELYESELFSSPSSAHSDNNLESQFINKEEFKNVCDAINELPSKCRKVFILKKIYGLSQKEIGAYTGLSESTIEKHVAKGILKCVKHMDKINSQEFQNEIKPGNAKNRALSSTKIGQ